MPAKGSSTGRLLAFLQVLLELAEGEAVDHASSLDPRPPRLRDAVFHVTEGPLVVGVGVDGDVDAGPDGLPDVGNGQVEAIDVGVELERRVRRGCLPDQTRHVDLVWFPAVEDAARRVAYGPDVRVVYGAHDALGHGLLANPERGVHAGHDEVERGQHVVLVVEGAVLEYVDLGAAEEADLVVFLVCLP